MAQKREEEAPRSRTKLQLAFLCLKHSTVVIGTDTAQCLIVHVPRDLNTMHAHGDCLNRNFISLFGLDTYIT